MNLKEANKRWQHPWLLAHRVDLHRNLKRIATTATKTRDAIPLRTASRVAQVVAETASITLEDGSQFHGDVVLGADGVHSATRHAVPGGQLKAECRGKSAFRFLVSKEAAANDPITAKLVQHPGELSIWYGNDSRIIMYPTSDNTVLNFVLIHPEDESAADCDNSWGQQGNLQKMLQIFDKFDPTILRLLGKAEPPERQGVEAPGHGHRPPVASPPSSFARRCGPSFPAAPGPGRRSCDRRCHLASGSPVSRNLNHRGA